MCMRYEREKSGVWMDGKLERENLVKWREKVRVIERKEEKEVGAGYVHKHNL